MLRFFLWGALGFSAQIDVPESACYGTTSNGRLEQGVKLPAKGPNFEGYSTVARLAGRTYVHSAVRDIVVAAYRDLEISQPTKVYKYAETGLRQGGEFKPHKTHRNGLSVDFMTPMKNQKGESVHLPTHPLNKFGYDIELDAQGHYEELVVDYEALAAHIVSLHKAAKDSGYDLWRVIFDPQLQAGLFTTQYGEYLRQNIQLSKKRSWVRHDEHYHVDFRVPCLAPAGRLRYNRRLSNLPNWIVHFHGNPTPIEPPQRPARAYRRS